MTPVLENAAAGDVLQAVEADLLQNTGGTAVEWYGRAGTALYRAYTIAISNHPKDQGAEVILPSISCATPANTALLAGAIPRFADVNSTNGMPTLEAIQARWTPKTRAVVFIHLFGQTADLRRLAAWCREKNVLLIEDLAQALGARLPDGNVAGSVGDLVVYSFNPTKILECGGGALVVRSKDLANISADLSKYEPLPPEIDDEAARGLALSYRNLHHSLVGLLRIRAVRDISVPFLQLQPAFRSLYLRRMKNPAALASAWRNLEEVLTHRLRNAEKYDEVLAGGPWQRLDQWRQSGVCWRYSLIVDFPERLVEFSEVVRREGFHVSNLYWPVNDFFRPEDTCPNADQFARRIINLWVDGSMDRQSVRKCGESLLKNAERFVA